MTASGTFDIEQVWQHPLDRFAVVDTRAETAYDDIARLAQTLCGTSIAMVSLVYHDRQWFKARVGTVLDWIPRDVTFCDYAMREPKSVFIVNDARKDPQFLRQPVGDRRDPRLLVRRRADRDPRRQCGGGRLRGRPQAPRVHQRTGRGTGRPGPAGRVPA